MSDTIETQHGSELGKLISKMKEHKNYPPPFMAVVSTPIPIVNERSYVPAPLNVFVAAAHGKIPMSEVISMACEHFVGPAIEAEQAHLPVRTSHLLCGLTIRTDGHGLEGEAREQWEKSEDINRPSVERMKELASQGHLALVVMTVSSKGFVISSHAMLGDGEVETMDTNINPFKDGEFGKQAIQEALARVLQESTRKEVAEENA
jgi:hypothetical protein